MQIVFLIELLEVQFAGLEVSQLETLYSEWSN